MSSQKAQLLLVIQSIQAAAPSMDNIEMLTILGIAISRSCGADDKVSAQAILQSEGVCGSSQPSHYQILAFTFTAWRRNLMNFAGNFLQSLSKLCSNNTTSHSIAQYITLHVHLVFDVCKHFSEAPPGFCYLITRWLVSLQSIHFHLC